MFIWLFHCIGTNVIDENPRPELIFSWTVSNHIDFFVPNNINDMQFLPLVASKIAKFGNINYEYLSNTL